MSLTGMIACGKVHNMIKSNSSYAYHCDGIPLPHASMESIKKWYKTQMELYRDKAAEGGTKREYFMRYAVAYNAICLLQTNMMD